MKRIVGLLLATVLTSSGFSQMSMGVDVFNRYVWRGSDFGNSASIQPFLEYSFTDVTIGAWGAWAINGAPGGNENDIYVMTSLGPVDLILTDYFFPEYTGSDHILDLESHTIEFAMGTELGPLSTTLAMNISGDDDNSTYLELQYKVLTLGIGNGFYSRDGNFAPVNIGVSGKKDNLSIAYIINPDQETSFLVLGVHF